MMYQPVPSIISYYPGIYYQSVLEFLEVSCCRFTVFAHFAGRDLLPMVAHPWTLAAGPLQVERPELTLY